MEIKEKLVDEEKMAIINYKGNVEDMGILIGKLYTWAELNKINVTGPPFAIYYTLPTTESPDDTIYDMGLPLENNEDYTGDDKIQVVDLLEHKVLSGIHKGPYDTIEDSYQKMVDYSIENDYDIIGSPKEIYLNSPYDVAPEDILVEIQFPVIKM
ncbi:GyrI-like domain-containing protein [Methanobrevibacter filiformis]|uniref:Bacterial transcription activator, effector binding domain n=1 Tax=Methanobrevibacter filiformis TaxID=55758 RepID=A0A166F5C1_9EURY|nr:GyrI-like domain-containing protein [Methanobrevibacter filiformis]KZX17331.1 bacterial transcription activator, effector binding domain [Methanobrevibacter filiformis]